MTRNSRFRLTTVIIVVLAMILSVFSIAVYAQEISTDHSFCAENGEYCLVCDVAAKVNALPDVDDITIDNAATVIQQINDIDRIKYDMTDYEYDEFEKLVETSGYGNVTRYISAVEKINALSGVDLTIQKKLNLGAMSIDDTSEAEVSFEITNIDTGSTQTLTLFDLSTGMSVFGADYYEMTTDGWTFAYKLPAGTYTIKELNQEKPITVNGTQMYFECTEISDGTNTEKGVDAADGMTVTLGAGETVNVSVMNSVGNSKAYLDGGFSTSWRSYLESATAVYINGMLPDGYNLDYDENYDAFITNGESIIYPIDVTDESLSWPPVQLYNVDTEIYIINGNGYGDPVCVSVDNASSLFEGATNLTLIDISKLDTSEATNMSRMFADCTNLTEIIFGDFNTFTTQRVETMEQMFYGCESLTSLNLSAFYTDNVENMSGMFNRCKSLEYLNISSFYTTCVKNMSAMFEYVGYNLYGTDKTTEIVLGPDIYTGNVTNMSSMFNYALGLSDDTIQTIVDKFNTQAVVDMSNMFKNVCKAGLEINRNTLNLSHFDTSSLTNVSGMFAGYTGYEQIILPHGIASKLSLSIIQCYADYPWNYNSGYLLGNTYCATAENMAALATDENATYTYVAHHHGASHNFVEGDTTEDIYVYCACGELAEICHMNWPSDTLYYDGSVLYVPSYRRDVLDSNYACDGELPVSYQIYYKAEYDGDYALVDSVINAGYYKVVMTVGEAQTYAMRANAGASASAFIEFEVHERILVNVTFKDFDGSVIDSQQADLTWPGTYFVNIPSYTLPGNDYYQYTFKYWLGSDGNTYYNDWIPSFNELYTSGYSDFTFTAVYDVKYLKEFHLEGSIDEEKTGLSDSEIHAGETVKIVSSGDSATVYTNYSIKKNDGIASLLLIPEYDDTFTISAVSINGELVYGTGAVSNKLIADWGIATVTGDDSSYNGDFKILLEGLSSSTATGDLFVQIVYTQETAVTGEYSFGFKTAYYSDTYENSTDSELSHNDRSEAYGVISASPLASFNELKVKVDDATIIIVARENTVIEIIVDEVVYDSEIVELYEDVDTIETGIDNVLIYHYGGCDTTLIDGITHDWQQYVSIKWYDAEGNALSGAPKDVGSYKVGISAVQNDYFNAVEEQIFDITITPYTIDVSVEALNEKTYNGALQSWVEDDFTIEDLIETFNAESGYTVVITNATYKNAGIYTVTLTFVANSNYTFGGTAGDEKVITVDVVMNKFALTVTAENKTTQYSDELAELTYVLSATDGISDASFARNDSDLRISLGTDASSFSDVGLYDITISATDLLENYDIILIHNQNEDADGKDNGTYMIIQKEVSVPTIDPLTYKSDYIFPTVPNGAEYSFLGDSQFNVGEYTLQATLSDTLNYVWVSEGIYYDNPVTVDWEIVPAKITVTLGNVTADYGKTEAEALDIVEIQWDIIQSTDMITDIVKLSFEAVDYIDEQGNVKVGTWIITAEDISENYDVTLIEGSYTVNKYQLSEEIDQITAQIIGDILEYTGAELSWNDVNFVLEGNFNGEALSEIIEIIAVEQQIGDYTNANGKLTDGVWTYYDPQTNLYYTVTVQVKADRQDAYTFNGGVSADVSAEVFIKQAANVWTSGPSVISTDINSFATDADAKFKADGEVTIVITDAEGNEVAPENLVAGNSYTATFTVAEANNYAGLNEIITFELGFAYVSIPNVYLDTEGGALIPAGGQATITYDAQNHRFVIVPDGTGKYTIAVNTADDYASWKNADTYFVTLALTENYSWSEGDRDDKVYTLVINKANLNITADDKSITYKDDAPDYTVTDSGFVGGESYATYFDNTFDTAEYLTCIYQKNDNAGTYDISFINNAKTALEAVLVNYDVTLNNGTLIVDKFVLDLNDVSGELDDEGEEKWADLTANGLTVEYDATAHSITVAGYPTELVPTVLYNGGAEIPKNAGMYDVTVIFAMAEGYSDNNYTWTDPAGVTLEITKVAITITASEQTTAYTGNPIIVGALTANNTTMSWNYIGAKNADEIGFITDLDGFTLDGFALNGEYTAVGSYADAIRVLYSFADGVAGNYLITFEDGTLIIEKDDLNWVITLETTNRDYNGAALKEGMNKVDYYAMLGDGANRVYLTYKFYTSNEEGAEALAEAPKNAGTYYVKAFYDDTINNAIESEYVEIVISKATVTISDVDDVATKYLQDYAVVPSVTKPVLAVDDGYVPSVTVTYLNGDGSVIDAKYMYNGQPLVAGTYQIVVSVDNLDDVNYTADDVVRTLTIDKATVSAEHIGFGDGKANIEISETTDEGEDVLKYVGLIDGAETQATVTWSANGIDNIIESGAFTVDAEGVIKSVYVNRAGQIEIVVDIIDETGVDNFEPVTIYINSYSVTFADDTANHAKNTAQTYDFSILAPVQYVWEGQSATQPSCSNQSAELITIDGYTFAKKWELGDTEYNFTNQVNGNIVLHALWNINKYTVTWMNGDAILETEEYEYLDIPAYSGTTPTREQTSEWLYTFSGWGEENDGTVVTISEITEDMVYYAIYTKEGVTYSVKFMLSIDGGNYVEYKTVNAKYGELLTDYCQLGEVAWFRGDIWYADEARYNELLTVPVGGGTAYGSYVFDIGNGDVNADGNINTDDITIYREWIVGGYAMTVVEEGAEWALVSGENGTFDENVKYFIKRVADVNADTSEDIRDITTVRMSIVGGYGYEISDGRGVSGQSVGVEKIVSYDIDPTYGNAAQIDGNTITVNCDESGLDDMGVIDGFAINVENLETAYSEEDDLYVSDCIVDFKIYDANGDEVNDIFLAQIGIDFGVNASSPKTVGVYFDIVFSQVQSGTTSFTVELTASDKDGAYETQTYTVNLVKN